MRTLLGLTIVFTVLTLGLLLFAAYMVLVAMRSGAWFLIALPTGAFVARGWHTLRQLRALEAKLNAP